MLGSVRQPAPLAVDDEPEEAAVRTIDTVPSSREGEVLPTDEPPADEADVDLLGPGRTPVTSYRPAAVPNVDRYGEAVVRQVLGARFVREEPYEPPTRFS